MRKKYTHIFFDLDNTLWDFKSNSQHALQITFNHFGLGNSKLNFEDFYKVYNRHNHQLWEAYRKKQVKKKELTHQRFQLTFNELGINGINADEMNVFYLDEMPKQNHLIDGAYEILEYLKTKGYKLFIITNGFKEVQHKKIINSGLAPYFQKVFISEEVQAPKPDPLIFEYAIKSANAKKNSSIMIGDDWDVDILGALNFGIDAIYFNPEDAENNISKNNIMLFSRNTEVLKLNQIRSIL